jgi:hypothetical protein
MASMESDIMTNLRTRLLELTWQNTVEIENIRLLSTDWRDHETPAIQIYDSGQLSESEQRRVKIGWTLTIELVMKNKVDDPVDQLILLDRMDEVLRKIGANVQLDLGSASPSQGEMIHIRYVNGITDLHTLAPFYIAVMNFEVIYLKPYTGIC